MEKRIRSPNYPAVSLKDAVDKIAQLYRNNHTHTAPREVIAKALGYTGLNGASATLISALNKYGLLEGRGDDLKVSERALSILHPHSKEEKAQALRAAASEPRLFADLAERFPGGVQNDELLRNYLLRNGFATNAVSHAIQAYRETSDFVAQEAAGYDSPSTPIRDDAIMNSPQLNTPTPPILQMPPSSRRPSLGDDMRVLHRFDFPEGGAVEISVSRDVDAIEALEIIKLQIPTLELVLNRMEAKRKQGDTGGTESASRTDESENE